MATASRLVAISVGSVSWFSGCRASSLYPVSQIPASQTQKPKKGDSRMFEQIGAEVVEFEAIEAVSVPETRPAPTSVLNCL